MRSRVQVTIDVNLNATPMIPSAYSHVWCRVHVSLWSKVDRPAGSGCTYIQRHGVWHRLCTTYIQNISGPRTKKSCRRPWSGTTIATTLALTQVRRRLFSRAEYGKSTRPTRSILRFSRLSVFLCSTPYALLPRANDTCLWPVVSSSRFNELLYSERCLRFVRCYWA